MIEKYYFINKFDTNNLENQSSNTTIIYRNYGIKDDLKTIIKLKEYCKKRRFRFLISNNTKLALNLDLDGAYIPSFNKSMHHLSFSKRKKFILIGSAHNNKEIKIKEKQGVNILLLSSLFKKNKNYLGINKFKLFSRLTKKEIVVLGGLSKKNIRKLKLLNNPKFAGISYFE